MANLEFPDAERRALGQAALDWVLRYFSRAAEPPIYPASGAPDLQALAAEPLPRHGQDPAQVLDHFARLAAFGRHNGHPRMFGYVQSSGNFAGAVGDFLASALNQNVTSWRSAPSATTVELLVIEWIKQLVGCQSWGDGVLLGGGSAANMAALVAALRASTDVDVNANGVAALPGAPVIYASDRVHMSVPKAASLIGVGRDAVRPVATTDGRMQVSTLGDMMRADRKAGRHLVCVVANAGDVNVGAIDPLSDLADLCQRYGVWLHVDGAYGGFAAAVPRLAPMFRGMERADSLALDPHKWLFAPVDAGCLLVRDASRLARAFSHGASYIDVVADREMSEFAFWDISPELSRRFRALKIWFALKCHGADAFVEAIERNVAIARHLCETIEGSDDFELLAPAPLSIVCFRHVPRRLAGNDIALDDLNRRVMVAVQRDGQSYLSNATIDGRFALRACIVNHRTTTADAAAVLDDIRRSAARL
jgi:glutamate/tyrosine decarboxylase-like PLP-dependent enzyme